MGFSAPLGLLALLAVPAVLILHLFRRRFRERRVGGLFLFAADALPAAAGRTRARLLRTPSLWLELLAAILLALLLGGLHVGAGDVRPHLVVVLDDSASMGARSGDGHVVDDARDAVLARLEALGEATDVTLVRTGPAPTVLLGPRGTPAQARAELAHWAPMQPDHDPAPAWDLALDLAGSSGELLYVTDRDDRPPPPRFRLRAFGASLANAAIASARRVPHGSQERVFADLLAWGERAVPTTVRLEVTADGKAREIARKQVTVDPRRPLHLAWTMPATPLPVRVSLGEDALAADDVALLLPEPARVVPVQVDLDEEAAKDLSLTRVLAAVPGVTVVGPDERAALRIGGSGVRVPQGGFALEVFAPGEARDAWIGPFLLERRRALGGGGGPPLLSGVTLEGVVWSAGRGPIPGLPLVLAGDQPLLTESSEHGGIRVRLDLDAAHSNLPASPDWPILVSNLVASARARLPGPVEAGVRLGGVIAYRAAGTQEDTAQLVLVGPDGRTRRARGWPLVTWDARTPGIHVLRRGETILARYAVNFVDPLESDLTHGCRADAPPTEAAGVATSGLARPGEREAAVLALLLLLALLADWFVLGRRR